jgi:hypothetical protein
LQRLLLLLDAYLLFVQNLRYTGTVNISACEVLRIICPLDHVSEVIFMFTIQLQQHTSRSKLRIYSPEFGNAQMVLDIILKNAFSAPDKPISTKLKNGNESHSEPRQLRDLHLARLDKSCRVLVKEFGNA